MISSYVFTLFSLLQISKSSSMDSDYRDSKNNSTASSIKDPDCELRKGDIEEAVGGNYVQLETVSRSKTSSQVSALRNRFENAQKLPPSNRQSSPKPKNTYSPTNNKMSRNSLKQNIFKTRDKTETSAKQGESQPPLKSNNSYQKITGLRSERISETSKKFIPFKDRIKSKDELPNLSSNVSSAPLSKKNSKSETMNGESYSSNNKNEIAAEQSIEDTPIEENKSKFSSPVPVKQYSLGERNLDFNSTNRVKTTHSSNNIFVDHPVSNTSCKTDFEIEGPKNISESQNIHCSKENYDKEDNSVKSERTTIDTPKYSVKPKEGIINSRTNSAPISAESKYPSRRSSREAVNTKSEQLTLISTDARQNNVKFTIEHSDTELNDSITPPISPISNCPNARNFVPTAVIPATFSNPIHDPETTNVDPKSPSPVLETRPRSPVNESISICSPEVITDSVSISTTSNDITNAISKVSYMADISKSESNIYCITNDFVAGDDCNVTTINQLIQSQEEEENDLDEELQFLESEDEEDGAQIISGPEDIIATKGQSATMTVSFSGTPPPEVTWLKRVRILCI